MTYVKDDGLSQLVLSVSPYPDLLLTGETIDQASRERFTIEALSDDADLGSPEPIDVAVQRWMTDGAVAATQGHENRTITFRVVISADTTVALTAGEAALAKRSGKIGTLSWVSPEGTPDVPTTVFEVWTMHLEHAYDDDDEVQIQRTYKVTITAKPWARSQNLTVSTAPAVPGVATTVEVDACTSLTGWTATATGPTLAGGGVKAITPVPDGGTTSSLFVTLKRSGTVTGLATTPYIMIDAVTAGGSVPAFIVQMDGVFCTKVAQIGSVRYFQVPAGKTSFTSLNIVAAINTTNRGGGVSLVVTDVSRTNKIGVVSTGKQLSRHLDVGGSVKTSGSIQLTSPNTTTLGNVLVYTRKDDGSGFNPSMRQYRSAGLTVTPDGSAVSGAREAYVNSGASAGTINFKVPLPEATYVVVGRFIMGSAATMTVNVVAVPGSGSPRESISATVTATAAGPLWAVLGLISPPLRFAPEADLYTYVATAAYANTGTHTLDELYLLDVTNGSFTLVTGVSRTRMWIDAPDADPVNNLPAIYLGNSSTRSDAQAANYANVLSIGDHDLDPDGSQLFTVTDNVALAAASASFYHRWHTSAGD